MQRPEVKQLEPPSGEWLFKLHGEVLGPVPSTEIIERMFSGEVDDATEISTGEGSWTSIQEVADFHPFLFQAKARIRAAQARLEAQKAARKRRIINLIKVAIGSMIILMVAFGASYFLIVNRPWREIDARAWAAKHVPLLSIPKNVALIEPNAGEKDQGIDINQIFIDDEPALVALQPLSGERGKSSKRRKRISPTSEGETQEEKQVETKTASLSVLTKEEINEVIQSKTGRLVGCIQRELSRNTELPSTIVVSFSIKNDGRVGEVRMEEIKLENGPLHQCFRQKLSEWKFRPFQGQVRNVDIPINIGKR